MLNEPRTYLHSSTQFILVMVVLAMLGVFILTTLTRAADYSFLIFFVIFLGIAFASTLFSMTQKTTISDDGISAQTIFGEKSLRWGEINRVSGSGYRIKLHNFDGDVIVAPSAQLPGYEEVVEWIGIKRPDLFNPLEYDEMKRNIPSTVLFAGFILLLVIVLLSFGVMSFYNNENLAALFPLAFVLLTIFVVFGIFFFFQPQSLTLEGKSLRVKYLFNERTLLADEIASIDLRYPQSRNGKSYFIQLSQVNKKKIKISGLSPSLPIVYLVLKNWRGKNSAIGLTTQRN
jgi:hypothetical protein